MTSLNGATQNLSDFPVQLAIHRGAGVDNGNTVFLNNHALSWTASPNDISFANQAGVVFDYWIEASNADAATVWVKIPSLPSGPAVTRFYLYYGKAGAASASNTSVCPGGAHNGYCYHFWDDFSSSGFACYENDITGGCAGSCITGDSVAQCTTKSTTFYSTPYAAYLNTGASGYCGDGGLVRQVTLPAGDSRIEFWARNTVTWGGFDGVAIDSGKWGPQNAVAGNNSANLDAVHWLACGSGTSSHQPDSCQTLTDFDTKIAYSPPMIETSWKLFLVEGTPWAGKTVNLRIILLNYSGSYCNMGDHRRELWVDDLGIRKYASPEPTWGTWGKEEPVP